MDQGWLRWRPGMQSLDRAALSMEEFSSSIREEFLGPSERSAEQWRGLPEFRIPRGLSGMIFAAVRDQRISAALEGDPGAITLSISSSVN
ncbi:hypothetical protein Taro_024451 [Colocasia esculenta]|uniref:Uncharacterized protein n=1 Tax=Colocasia esculenta TaxID=4460 RepID=A0A843V7H1_COLES|nr:hypothetical protein [Colocasia esculenta]